jgi:hypothetical protein
LLCNVYLHRLDRAWDVREHGVLVRYADDALVLCTSRQQAKAALAGGAGAAGRPWLGTKAGQDADRAPAGGREGYDFLGFEHRLVRHAPRRGAGPSPTWPAGHEQGHAARPRPDSGTDPPVPAVAARRGDRGDLNRFLHGWAAYFKYGNSTRHFDKIRHYARMRLALFISTRHRRSRAFGWWVVGVASPNQLGLVSLIGIVVAPDPFGTGEKSRMPAVNASVSRVREKRMHGSTGAAGNRARPVPPRQPPTYSSSCTRARFGSLASPTIRTELGRPASTGALNGAGISGGRHRTPVPCS